MRGLIAIIGFAVFLAGAVPEAQADESKGMMNPCMKKNKMNHHKMKREFMNEGMGILLDTIILLKESATDPKIKNKAAALETRMRDHLQKHDEMHKKMKEMHKMHKKGHNPCAMGKHK